MNRKSSSLISLGVSAALIAGVIWFLYYLNATPFGRMGDWHVSHQRWMMGGGGLGIVGGGMGIIVLIFWILVIAAAALLISGALSNRFSNGSNAAEPTALDVLKERHARGEIDRAAYEAMKRELLQ